MRWTGQQGSQRGAITIQVALALIALLAFSSFVIDYGVLWIGRHQAQNAADAGAMAGAISLIRDIGGTVRAKQVATTLAGLNSIWGESNVGNVAVDVSGTGPGEISDTMCGSARGCVRVDVLRGERGHTGGVQGNPLPTFFARLLTLGLPQRIKATATARVVPANALTCLRSLAIPDVVGTGYTLAGDFGNPVTITYSAGAVTPGAYDIVDQFGGTFAGGAQERIKACTPAVIGKGDPLTVDPAPQLADFLLGMQALYNLDPSASWDPSTQRVVGSCTQTQSCLAYDATGSLQTPDPDAAMSPRVIAVPVYDPTLVGGPTVTISNIIGLFIESVDTGPPYKIVGRVVTLPGRLVSGKGSIPAASAFINTAVLAR